MITLQDYWMGRDREYASSMTPQIEKNAELTLRLVNALLARFGQYRKVNSGWRPPALNALTPGAAKFSRHMTGEAIDLEDHEGDLDDWLLGPVGTSVMATLGLWSEHPAATKGWAHLQIVPPRSGNRHFYP